MAKHLSFQKILFLLAFMLPLFALRAQETDTTCVLTLPMQEDFESYPGDFSSIPTCWSKISA